MPEGHTIHRIARDHKKWFSGQKMSVCSPQGRFAVESAKINGRLLRDVSAHGKHLFYHWSRDLVTHIHLGLYGKFRSHRNPPPEPRGAVRVRMVGSGRYFDLTGPNCCELIDHRQFVQLKSRLGEDPLRDDASVETVWKKVEKSRSPIGSLLLNQAVIAGVGNVYRAEILFIMGIHPQMPASQIGRETFEKLWELTSELLQIGVRYNRIITSGFNSAGGVPKYLKASERLNIYKRSRCGKCDGPVKNWELANRRIYACANCQKLK